MTVDRMLLDGVSLRPTRYFGGCACAVSSMAEALRCRAVGRCASQHDTEQNISLMRPELQVDTEQRQYFEPN